MDQARWLVVFSVAVAMITTLTLLHRYSTPDDADAVVNPGVQSEEIPAWQNDASGSENSDTPIRPEKIKYSKPPGHVFSVENPSKFHQEEEEMKDKGDILP